MKIELAKTEVIHFIGIGGIGMSGLSLIMKGKEFKVQGSDIASNKNIERLNKEGFFNTSIFEIGYHKKLERIEKQKQKNIDVLMYGSMNERRKKIVDGLKEKKLNVKVLFGIYGAQRDEYISRSKIVLNIHFYNSQLFEIVRVLKFNCLASIP